MSAEPTREELIRKLRAIYGPETLEHDAADLLEADAAEIADWRKGQAALSSRIVELEALVREIAETPRISLPPTGNYGRSVEVCGCCRAPVGHKDDCMAKHAQSL